jgi:hypothetical protein
MPLQMGQLLQPPLRSPTLWRSPLQVLSYFLAREVVSTMENLKKTPSDGGDTRAAALVIPELGLSAAAILECMHALKARDNIFSSEFNSGESIG